MKKNGWAVKFQGSGGATWWLTQNRECDFADTAWNSRLPRYVFGNRERALACLRYARGEVANAPVNARLFKLVRIGNPPSSKVDRVISIMKKEIEKEEDYLNECRDGGDYAEALKAEERIAAHEWTLEQLENL